MNKEQALVVQSTILSRIAENIPSDVVEPLWRVYTEEFEPQNIGKPSPCSCQPKTWREIVKRVRDRVNEVIHAEVYVVQEVLEDKVKKQIVKKKKS